MRTFKLIKPLPNLPKNTIFKTTFDNETVFAFLDDTSSFKRYTFTLDEVLNDTDYFQEITGEIHEKEKHLKILIDKVADNLQFEQDSIGLGVLYLDPKRPFGFSGTFTIIRQILEFIGIEESVGDFTNGTNDFSEADKQYARDLFQKDLLPAIVKKLKS
jgi:hypothetical protein